MKPTPCTRLPSQGATGQWYRSHAYVWQTRSFATSNFKGLYKGAKVPKNDLALLTALESFIDKQAKKSAINDKAGSEFQKALRKEAMQDAKGLEEMFEDVSRFAQRLWTSVSVLQDEQSDRRELCWLINEAIRQDDLDLLSDLMGFFRAINSLNLANRKAEAALAKNWPSDGLCYRGTGLPEQYRAFFTQGIRCRVPGFLATSLSRDIAISFADRACGTDRSISAALMIIAVDSAGQHDHSKRCRHVSYVESSNLGDAEQEFLFAPYSVFTVTKVDWAQSPATPSQPHCIYLVAAYDNLAEPEDLPLAPWY